MNGQFHYDLAEFLPFRDAEACRRVRAIKRADVTKHPKENFRIRVIEDETAFRFAYVMDIVAGIKRALDEGRKRYVLILPAPNPHYAFVAKMLNDLNIPCHHVHTFNMDEYADQDGNTAPATWNGGFQYWMWHDLFDRIRPELRMPESQIHFPTTQNVDDYTQDARGHGRGGRLLRRDRLVGPHRVLRAAPGPRVRRRHRRLPEQGARIVDLHPITVCQNCLYADAGSAGDWSWCRPRPPRSARRTWPTRSW